MTRVIASGKAFAAVDESDGSVVVWEDPDCGGDAASAIQAQLARDVESVTGGSKAFAALKSDGSLIAWGDPRFGGDAGSVREQIARDSAPNRFVD